MKFDWQSMVMTLAVIAAGCGRGIPTAADESDAVPRYQFAVGQELSYRDHSDFEYKNGKLITREKWTFWIINQNADGSFRVVTRNDRKFSQVRDEAEKDNKDDSHVAWFDIFPDGRLVRNRTLGSRIEPAKILPQLPCTLDEVKDGWEMKGEAWGGSTRFESQPAKHANRFVFAGKEKSLLNDIYGMERESLSTLDTNQGLLVKIESKTRQTYGFEGKGTGTSELVDVANRSPEWSRQLLADATRYFELSEQFEKAAKDRNLKPDELKSELERLHKELEALVDGLQTEEFRQALARQAESREREIQYYAEDAESRLSQIGTPAFEFDTTDLAGDKHALSDYRGKVVILDFWYRGCGWCVRAMPQMKEIAAHFADRPVVVFGMNTDKKDEDAEFVVEKMQLNYKNLKADGLPKKYKVSGFPTLIIVDPEGIVQDIHVGYSPKLKEQVVESVERILKSSP